MNIRKSVAIAAAGAVAVVGLGASGAVADRMIGSKQLKQNAVKSKHIKNGTIKGKDLAKGLRKKVNAPGEQGPAGKDGTVAWQTATMANPTTIEHIGGSINADYTPLETSLTLQPGTYVVTVDGSFFNTNGDFGADVYPQISLWVERNGDEGFQWQDDGDISPNALIPSVADRHIAVSGNSVLTVTEETEIALIAHGYTSTKGSQGSGDILVDKATLTAAKIS